MSKTKRPRFSFGKLGDQLSVALRKGRTEAAKRRLEEVAAQLGADLTDPDQFRVVRELADAA